MIVHLFNSSSISGPEKLVLPALSRFGGRFHIVNLLEDRIPGLGESDPLADCCRSLGLPYTAIRVSGRWDRRALRELKSLLRAWKPSLAHAHALKASVYLALAQGRKGRAPFPLITTHHGVHGLPDMKVTFYEWLYRKFFSHAFDRVLAVSRADFDFLTASGMDPARLRLHQNGIDAARVLPDTRPALQRQARLSWLPKNRDRDALFLMGVVARLSPEKDHEKIFRVLAGLNQLPCDKDWRCLIFGSGAMEERLRQSVHRLNLESRVLWMGYRKTVSDELAGLDLLLSFSKAEGLPINLIEAGWAGTPVLCTPVGGVTELIPDETYGNWVRSDEGDDATARRIQVFMTPKGQIGLQAQAGPYQERVKNEFSQDAWVRRLQDLYFDFGVRFTPAAGSDFPKEAVLCR